MTKEDNFAEIFDGMNHNYEQLEGVLADLYEYLQNNNDERLKDVFFRLCSVGKGMIYSQTELTKAYGDPSISDSLIHNLDSKAEALSIAEEANRSKLK